METHSELQRKIKALEKLLQEETFARSAFEHELYEIKDSLAWRLVTRCRHFRNRLLGEDTRRRKSYELMRDILKGAILLETRKSRVGFRDMPPPPPPPPHPPPTHPPHPT